MKNIFSRLTLATILTVLIITTPTSSSATPTADSQNAFACDLFQQLATTQDGNLLFSPTSIAMGLGMTWSGAQGKTAQEMSSVLHLHGSNNEVLDSYASLLKDLNSPHGAYTLQIVNRLWGQQGLPFLDSFLDPLKQKMKASLVPLDFSHRPEDSRLKINQWVSQQTEAKIPELLNPGLVTTNTELILTNAAYFKAPWSKAFKNYNTHDATFDTGTQSVTVPFMHQTQTYQYFDAGTAKLLALPYAGDQLEMLIILPGDSAELPDLEHHLNAQTLNQWQKSLHSQQVVLSLPRFKITDSFSLKNTLSDLGMPAAFDPNQADFSGMTGTKELYISHVAHKAFIEVDEAGTEAAAATAIVVERLGGMEMQDYTPFKADHPFLFLIIHRPSQAVLFMGRVTDPR